MQQKNLCSLLATHSEVGVSPVKGQRILLNENLALLRQGTVTLASVVVKTSWARGTGSEGHSNPVDKFGILGSPSAL